MPERKGVKGAGVRGGSRAQAKHGHSPHCGGNEGIGCGLEAGTVMHINKSGDGWVGGMFRVKGLEVLIRSNNAGVEIIE